MADSSGHHSIIFGVSPVSDTVWDFARYDGEESLMDCTAEDEQKQPQQPGINYSQPAAAAALAACHQVPAVTAGAFGDAMTEEDWEILGHLESAFGCQNSITNFDSSNWRQQQQQQPVTCRGGRISPGGLPQLQCGAAAAATATVFSSGSANATSHMQQEVLWTGEQQQQLRQCYFSVTPAMYSAAAIEANLEAAAAAMDPNLSANSEHTADAQNASGCSRLLGSRSPGTTAAAAAAATTAAAASAVAELEAGGRRPCAAATTTAVTISMKRSGSSSSSTRYGKGQRISRARHDQEMNHLVEQVEHLTADNQRLQQRTITLLSSEQDMLKRVAALTTKWHASVAANNDLQRENIALRQQLAAIQQRQQQK